jgi:ubiquinone/menaquinone biosynthesis C-methylase UbiE
LPPATESALSLFDPLRRPAEPSLVHGYVDLLGETDPTASSALSRAMVSRVLPLIYERIWRPLGARLLMGLRGPATKKEHRMALEMLAISPGDRVLDVACGPGNFTGDFAAAAEGGLAVGIDASETMLGVAAADVEAENVAYVRGDACDLPFRDGSFDAVCCFAALYLIEEPMKALAEISRVLAPGGRVALMATCHRGPLPISAMREMARKTSGATIFHRDDLTGALAAEGYADIEQRVIGFAQYVSGRRPA